MNDEHEIRRRADRKLQIVALLIGCGLLGVPSVVGSITGSGSRAQAHTAIIVKAR